jgi:hypothetical protein
MRYLGLAIVSGLTLGGCPMACPALHWNTTDYGDGGHAGHTGTGATGGTGGTTHTGGGGTGGHVPDGGTVLGSYSVLQGTGYKALNVVGLGVVASGDVILAGWRTGDGTEDMDFGLGCGLVSSGAIDEGFVVRLDPDLKCLEVRRYTGSKNVRLTALSVSGDSFAVAGTYMDIATLPSGHNPPPKPGSNGASDAFVSVESAARNDAGGIDGSTYVLTGIGVETIRGLVLSGGDLYLTGTVTGSKNATFTHPAGNTTSPTSSFTNWGFAVSTTSSPPPPPASLILDGDGTVPNAIAVDGNGLVSIVGQASGNTPPGDGGPADGKDAFLAQYTAGWTTGPVLRFGGAKDQSATGVLAGPQGLYVFGAFDQQLEGFSSGALITSVGGSDAFLGLVPSSPSLPTGLVRFGSGGANDVAFAAMAVDGDAVYATGGLAGLASLYTLNGVSVAKDLPTLGTQSIYLFKMDPLLGSLTWGAQYGDAGLTQGADAVALGSAGPYIAGPFASGLYLDDKNNATGTGIFVAKVAP